MNIDRLDEIYAMVKSILHFEQLDQTGPRSRAIFLCEHGDLVSCTNLSSITYVHDNLYIYYESRVHYYHILEVIIILSVYKENKCCFLYAKYEYEYTDVHEYEYANIHEYELVET